MKNTVTLGEFRTAFNNMGRNDNFSYRGLEALYNYITELESDCGMEIELDVIALCCEYTEYENFEELQKDYNVEDMNELERNTTVIMIDSESFIIQAY